MRTKLARIHALFAIGLAAVGCGRLLGFDDLHYSSRSDSGGGGDAAGGVPVATSQAGAWISAGRGGGQVGTPLLDNAGAGPLGQAGATDDCVIPSDLSCAPSSCPDQACGGYLWDAATVPFRFLGDLPSALRARVASAMSAWSSGGPASVGNFEECATDDCSKHTRWLEIRVGDEVLLSPSVLAAAQVLTLTAQTTEERVAHELGHVLGLPDEWRRPDRDRFVRLSEAEACGKSKLDLSICASSPFDGLAQPSRRVTGFYGAFDPGSVMNLPQARTCEGADGRLTATLPSAGDRAALAELYRTKQGWSQFLPLGRDVSPNKPLEHTLTNGVALAGPVAISSMSYPQVHVYARGTDGGIYWKTQNWSSPAFLDWGEWAPLGCCYDSLAAAAWGVDRTDLFASSNGEVWWRTLSGKQFLTWNDWNRIGAPIAGAASGPAATSRGGSKLDVFVRGTDAQLYWTTYAGGTWSSWTKLGNASISATPAAAAGLDQEIDVVVAAAGGGLLRLKYRDGWDAAYTVLDGALLPDTSPALAASDGQLHLFVTAPETHHLLERVATGDQWGDWQDLGGVLEGSPVALGIASRRHVDLAGVIKDAGQPALWLRSWPFQKPCFVAGDSCGSCQEACGGACSTLVTAAASPAFFVDENGDDRWVFRATDRHIYSVAGQPLRVTDLGDETKGGPLAGGDPMAYVRSDGLGSVLYRSISEEVCEDFRLQSPWAFGNLTQYTDGPPVAGDPSGYVRSDHVNSVVTRDSLGNVREIYLAGGAWYDANLSLVSFAPQAAGNPRPYVRADQGNAIYFRDVDGGLAEIYLTPGGWLSENLAMPAGVKAVGDPSAYVTSDSQNSLAFRSDTGELFLLTEATASHIWSGASLTLATGAPLSATDPRAYLRSDGVDAVVYATATGAVYELSRSGTTWSAKDLTAAASASPTLDHPVPYVRADSVNAVAYLTADGSVVELSLDAGQWKQRPIYTPPQP